MADDLKDQNKPQDTTDQNSDDEKTPQDDSIAASQDFDGVDEANLIVQFEKRLMEDMGFANLTPEEEKSVKAKIESLVNNRIINLMMILMPEDKLKEFEAVFEQNDNQKTIEFVEDNIPNWDDKVLAELLQLKDDLMR